jgi:membrane associated rhomboid family serine protease
VARTRDTRLYVGVIGFWLQGLEVGHLVQVAQGEVVMTNGWERLKAEWRHTPVYDIYALVAVCCFVHLLWVIEGWRYGRVGGLFMRRHFTASLLNLSSLRLWTFVTCSVSHEETMHLLHNMLWLLAMGPELQVCIGREAVIVLYFWGGLCGGCCSMMMHAPGAEGLGASAAVYALEGFSVVLHPGRYYMWMGQ